MDLKSMHTATLRTRAGSRYSGVIVEIQHGHRGEPKLVITATSTTSPDDARRKIRYFVRDLWAEVNQDD